MIILDRVTFTFNVFVTINDHIPTILIYDQGCTGKKMYTYIYLIKVVPVTQSCVPSHEPLSHVRLQGGRVCLQSQSSSSVSSWSSWSLSYITTIISSLSLLVITVVHQCDDSSVEALEAATVVLHKGSGQISKGGVLGGGLERLGHGNIAQNFRSNLKRCKRFGRRSWKIQWVTAYFQKGLIFFWKICRIMLISRKDFNF